MAKIHALADFQEARCPACGAAINTGATSRKRKVQCPKCREIVELGKPEPVATVLPNATSARLEELEARLVRLETLEARIAALESPIQPVAIVPFPEPAKAPPAHVADVLPQPARKLRWLAPSEGHRAAVLPIEVQDVLHHNLTTFTANILTLRAPAEDPVEWERAKQFKAIFERASWRVSGPDHAIVRRGNYGLSLAVGNLPPPADAVAIHLALTASGFGLDSILDPGLGGSEAVLIVG
jgi:hypothetical protein